MLSISLVVATGLIGVSAVPALAACPAPGSVTHQVLLPSSFASGAKFGAATATGDFNKDGFADLAVGAPKDQVNGVAAGTVTVFYGSAGGLGSGARLTQSNVGAGNEAGDQFGTALAAGDFNRDGYADLAVGAPGESIGGIKGGMIGVLPGSASGLSTGHWYAQGSVIGGANENGDQLGAALAAGDLNGDGFVDLAIGTPGEAIGTTKSGAVWVVKGSSSGVAKGWLVEEGDADGLNEAGDKFGASLAIGNVTGDSHADLVVGAPGEAPGSNPASGAIFVVPGAASGKSAGFNRTETAAGEVNEAGDNFGASVAAGNLDGDGFADIVVGAPTKAPGSEPASGAVMVFPGVSGMPSGFTLTENLAAEALRAGDRFGAAVATGDVDGDGFADVLVGAPVRSVGGVSGAGVAFLFGGRPRTSDSAVDLNPGRPLTQSSVGEVDEAGDAFGAAVVFGDVDNNGRADAMIGASGEAPTGQSASGDVVKVSGLAACGSVSIEEFAGFSAMQIAPVGGAAVGTLEYAYVDNIGRLVHGHQANLDDFGSLQWTVISGNDAFSGQPVLAQQPDGRLQAVGRNIDSGFWANTQATATPPAWGAWVDQGGLGFSIPAVARLGDGRLVAFAVDSRGVLWAMPQRAANGSSTMWRSLGAADLTGAPTAIVVSNGIQVFALDSSGALKTALYSASGTLSAWTSLGGTGLNGVPALVLYPGFFLRVFIRAADGSIQTKMQDGTGAWPQVWDTVGTFTSAGSPAALLSPVTGKTEVVARGTDGVIYSTGETAQGSRVWRSWVNASDPSEVAVTDPTSFTVSGSVNGYSWAFVFLRNDGVRRVYTVNETLGGLSATAAESRIAAPQFSGHTLPAPPK